MASVSFLYPSNDMGCSCYFFFSPMSQCLSLLPLLIHFSSSSFILFHLHSSFLASPPLYGILDIFSLLSFHLQGTWKPAERSPESLHLLFVPRFSPGKHRRLGLTDTSIQWVLTPKSPTTWAPSNLPEYVQEPVVTSAMYTRLCAASTQDQNTK